MKSFAVIGLGLFGTKLAKELYEEGYNVLAIDCNEACVNAIADHVTQAIVLDAKNREVLLQIGIGRYDCVIVAIATDLATSVLITMNLKALEVPQIVCKVQNKVDQEVLETLGATSCTIPEEVGAKNLAHKLTSKNVLDFTQLSTHHSIIEIPLPGSWLNRSVLELNIRVRFGINVIAIRRDGRVQMDFDPALPFQEGDTLIILGNNKRLEDIQRIQ